MSRIFSDLRERGVPLRGDVRRPHALNGIPTVSRAANGVCSTLPTWGV